MIYTVALGITGDLPVISGLLWGRVSVAGCWWQIDEDAVPTRLPRRPAQNLFASENAALTLASIPVAGTALRRGYTSKAGHKGCLGLSFH